MLISRCSVEGCKWNPVEEVHIPLYVTLREVGKSDCFTRSSFLCFLFVLLQLPPAEILDSTSQYQFSASLPEEDHRCHRTYHRAESSAYSTQLPSQTSSSSVLRPRAACHHEQCAWSIPHMHTSDLSFIAWHCAPTHRLHLHNCYHLSTYTQANSSKYTHAAATSHCITPTETKSCHDQLMYKCAEVRDKVDAQREGCVHRLKSSSVSVPGSEHRCLWRCTAQWQIYSPVPFLQVIASMSVPLYMEVQP